jgi:hypothetical protein
MGPIAARAMKLRRGGQGPKQPVAEPGPAITSALVDLKAP